MGEKLWQVGEVSAVYGGIARIRLSPTSSCERCLAGRGCGAGVFTGMFARRAVELTIMNTVDALPGQRVLIGVAGLALARAALRLYGVPLFGFMVGVLLAAWAMPAAVPGGVPDDFLVLGAGFTVAVLSFLVLVKRPLAGIEPELRLPTC